MVFVRGGGGEVLSGKVSTRMCVQDRVTFRPGGYSDLVWTEP